MDSRPMGRLRLATRTVAGLTAAIVGGAAGACGAAGDGATGGGAAEVATEVLSGAQAVVTTQSALLASVADLSIGADGRLYVLDQQYQHVLAVTPSGDNPQTFGRAGSGPGEFDRPAALSVGPQRLWVYDRGNGRVNVFDTDGAVRRTYGIAAGSPMGGAALNRHGQLALGTGGLDSAMVAVFSDEGAQIASFGAPIVPPTSFFDLTAMKETIRSGAVPDQLRNNAQPVWGSDGSVWLLFQTEAQIRRYTGAGELRWERTIAGPVLEAVRRRFFKRNVAEDNPSILHGLAYFVDAQEVEGDLWVLLASPEAQQQAGKGSVLLILDGGDGSVARRILLPEVDDAGPFVFDPERRRLYIVKAGAASIVAFPLS